MSWLSEFGLYRNMHHSNIFQNLSILDKNSPFGIRLTLLMSMFRKAQGENIVRCLNVGYDDFRKEIWVVSMDWKFSAYKKCPTNSGYFCLFLIF